MFMWLLWLHLCTNKPTSAYKFRAISLPSLAPPTQSLDALFRSVASVAFTRQQCASGLGCSFAPCAVQRVICLRSLYLLNIVYSYCSTGDMCVRSWCSRTRTSSRCRRRTRSSSSRRPSASSGGRRRARRRRPLPARARPERPEHPERRRRCRARRWWTSCSARRSRSSSPRSPRATARSRCSSAPGATRSPDAYAPLLFSPFLLPSSSLLSYSPLLFSSPLLSFSLLLTSLSVLTFSPLLHAFGD